MNYTVINIIYCVISIIAVVILFYLYYYNNIVKTKIETFASPKTSKRPEQTSYIFWTGGYDSTFRILQALLIDKIQVVPIYLSGIIDNDVSKSTRRKNHHQEIKAIQNITKIIHKTYPKQATNLKPLILIPEVKLSRHISENMKILHQRRMVRRPVCQYGALAQVCFDMNRHIELAVEREPQSSMMYSSIHDKVEGNRKNRRIKKSIIQQYPELEIYKFFIFSTLEYSKKDMLEISKRHGFRHILDMTWSCWYPHNGKPCGRCIMCRERLI